MILIIQSAAVTFMFKEDHKEEFLIKQEGELKSNLVEIRHLFKPFNTAGLPAYFYL